MSRGEGQPIARTTCDQAPASPESPAPAGTTVDAALDRMTRPDADSNLSEAIQKLKSEWQESNERALRAQAELENFRKRSRREMEDERRYAALPVMRDILNVCDNLDRAIQAAEKEQTGTALLEGVKMVSVQLHTYLEQHHCRRVDAVGTPFDPHRHEAIAQEPSTEHPAGYVTRVTRQGYQLHDRVVRPAQVMVSTGAPVP